MSKKPKNQRRWSKHQKTTEIIAYAVAQENNKQAPDLTQLIQPCSPRRSWMDDTPHRYAYRCIPMTAANTMGWELLNPHTCEITWTGGDLVADTLINVSGVPDGSGVITGLPKSHFGSGIVTWELPFIFRTSPGVGLVITGPPNAVKRGAAPLEGFVETDWLPNGFTMNWKITEPEFPVVFEAGEPYCRIIPYKREYIESFQVTIHDPDTDKDFKERVIAWRSDRLDRLKSKDTDPAADPKIIWSGDYVKGSDSSGNVYAGHKNVFRCKPVKDSRDR